MEAECRHALTRLSCPRQQRAGQLSAAGCALVTEDGFPHFSVSQLLPFFPPTLSTFSFCPFYGCFGHVHTYKVNLIFKSLFLFFSFFKEQALETKGVALLPWNFSCFLLPPRGGWGEESHPLKMHSS